MTDEFVDLFPYDLPENFRPGTTFAGVFVNVFISNQENLRLPVDDERHEDKPKYAFSCAVPYENRKTFTRESQSVKFSCNEQDYRYLQSVKETLKFQPVYLVCVPDSWQSGNNHGLYYRYISDSIRRFDGKPVTEKKGNS
ncbi:hypothetical protein DOA20_26130 [Salmonella enterica subsp. enterica serovar Newport]|nr:hypothetical protein [Salmonella enterica subsp. enterica serovar Newport]